MTLEKAQKKAEEMLSGGASRSDTCSFVNTLASSKLISEAEADRYADTLAADRGNAPAVLRAICKRLTSPSKPERKTQ